ncbi:hypothetical protein LSG31_02905 [Fodinisporobacter ferrooxydans]|uniref:Uncharacterized protein n=1 Tax=Fodinisporobacter ferrooxydans TaxID=2901836 RepID=A0ABY4CLC9_9BACL|nr:hypothetical protein LSG31_02905 [Alicyclobacillaceae bacterium MYW30-H2]
MLIIDSLFYWMGFSLLAIPFQLRHGLAPEMVAESADGLLHFPERAFDLETVSVSLDDVRRRQVKIGAHKNGQEVAIQEQDCFPERLGGYKSLIDHLHNMGVLSLSWMFPAEDGFHTILQVHELREAEPLPRCPHKDADGAKQMAKDICGFSGKASSERRQNFIHKC